MSYEKYIKQQTRVYDKSKPIKDWRTDLRNTKSNKLLIDMVPQASPGDRALDIGAGEGYHTQDLLSKGYDAVGIELSPKRVADAKKFGRPVIEGDAHTLPWPENTFKSVYMHEVLEHCAYPQKVLEQIYRVLVSNGKVFISLPLEGHWKKPQNNMDEHNLDIADNHVWKPTAQMLWDALDKVGFHSFHIKLYTLDSIVYKMDFVPGKKVGGFRPHAFVIGTK